MKNLFEISRFARNLERKKMFIDTHAHLFYQNFENDVDEVIERAKNSGRGKNGSLTAIRQFCLECQGASAKAVRACADEECPLWAPPRRKKPRVRPCGPFAGSAWAVLATGWRCAPVRLAMPVPCGIAALACVRRPTRPCGGVFLLPNPCDFCNAPPGTRRNTTGGIHASFARMVESVCSSP